MPPLAHSSWAQLWFSLALATPLYRQPGTYTEQLVGMPVPLHRCCHLCFALKCQVPARSWWQGNRHNNTARALLLKMIVGALSSLACDWCHLFIPMWGTLRPPVPKAIPPLSTTRKMPGLTVHLPVETWALNVDLKIQPPDDHSRL